MKKILVVDDESVTRRLVSFTLKSLNIETIGAGGAAEALEQAAHDSFAMAILDINMPEMDGFELYTRLRALPTMQHIPIVMFTARSEKDDQVRALDLGAAGLLYKPFSTHELRQLVTRLIG